MIAGREARHTRADLLDHPGALVPEHGRRVTGGIDTAGGVEVGVANAAGRQAHQHLTGARPVEVDLLDHERPGELLENGGADLHGGNLTGERQRTGRTRGRRPATATVRCHEADPGAAGSTR